MQSSIPWGNITSGLKTMLEKDIERHFKEAVEKKGYLCLKFLSTSPGIPDRIVFGGGRCFLVELKNGAKGRVSPIQKLRFAEFERAGFPVVIIRTFEDTETFVAKLPILKGAQ